MTSYIISEIGIHYLITYYISTSRERGSSGLRELLQSTDTGKIKHFQHLLSVEIDFNNIMLQSGNFGHIIVFSFTVFFLQFDGNTSDLRVPEALHQMCNEVSDFVTQRFGGNDSDLFADPFVGVEVEAQLRVVFFNDNL